MSWGTRFKLAFLLPGYSSAEVLSGLLAIAWGTWVANPLWSVFEVSPTYSAFYILPEIVWGSLAALLGGLQLSGVVFASWRSRRWASLGLVAFWSFVTAAFVLGNFRSTATVIYPFVVLINIRAYLRLKLMACHESESQHE